MRKQLWAFGILLLVICVTFSSCGELIVSKLCVDVAHLPDEPLPTLVYNDRKYILEMNNWFGGETEDGKPFNTQDNGIRLYGFLYLDFFYTYEKENPLYIYSPEGGQFYFREDYDPKTDNFILEGTQSSMSIIDIMAEPVEKRTLVANYESIIVFHSETHPHLRLALMLFFYNGEWRFRTSASGYSYQGRYSEEYPDVQSQTEYFVTEELRNFLIENHAFPES